MKSKSIIAKFCFTIIIALLLASCSATVTQNVHLKYGNPSNAKGNLKNYLIQQPEYALAYNCQTGTANWVSWQLDRSWLGRTERSNDFRPNPELPESCYAVRPNDYRGTGYDRGHLVPSGDRTHSKADNSSTFLMTNIIPQSPSNNREVWRELEEHCRDLVFRGKELYLVAGGTGTAKKIAQSKVVVPKYTWKVVLVLDAFAKEVTPDNASTIAVLMPNSEAVRNTRWQDYLVSVDAIERKTGYNFFSALPKNIQSQIEQTAIAQ